MKRVFSVSYDLNRSGKDYAGLHGELKRTYEWYHLLDSTWMLYTVESADQIWDRLKSHIDRDDHILIIQVNNNKQGWLPKPAWDWLNSRLSQLVS